MAVGNCTTRGKLPPLPLIKSFLEVARIAASIKPSRLPSGVNVEFVEADAQAVVIDREVWEVGYTRPALVGIVGTRRIEGVNEIVTGWIRSLANGEIYRSVGLGHR